MGMPQLPEQRHFRHHHHFVVVILVMICHYVDVIQNGFDIYRVAIR